MMPMLQAPDGRELIRFGGGGIPTSRALVSSLPDGGYDPTHPLVGASVSSVDAALRESEQGYLARLMDLYEDLRERDSHIAAIAQTRVLAVAGRSWTVQAADNSGAARLAAARVAKVWDRIPRRREALTHLAEGILNGLAVLEQEWADVSIPGLSGTVQMPVGLHWIAPGRLGYDDQQQVVKRDYADPYEGRRLADLGRDRFIIHCPVTRSTYPVRRGVLRACVFTSMVKRFGLRWWVSGLERHGLPGLYVSMPTGNAELKDEAKNFLRKLGTDFAGVLVGEGMDVKEIPGFDRFTGQAHMSLADYCDKQNSKAILGQTMTSDDGASLAQANVHDRVRQDLLQADVDGLAETLRDDLLEPIVRYNWPGLPVPRLVPDMRPRFREIQSWHLTEGVVTADEVRESLGKPPHPDGSGAAPRVPMGTAPSGGGSGDGRQQPEERHAPGEAPEHDERTDQRTPA